jgi:hypothetical protein
MLVLARGPRAILSRRSFSTGPAKAKIALAGAGWWSQGW